MISPSSKPPSTNPARDEVQVRNLWLSVDPYMRGLMGTTRTYIDPYHLGEVMTGGAIGTVEISNHPKLAEGDLVLSNHGWRDRFVANGDGVHPIDPESRPAPGLSRRHGDAGFHRLARDPRDRPSRGGRGDLHLGRRRRGGLGGLSAGAPDGRQGRRQRRVR